MKKIEAIIRPSKLEDVKQALSHAWIAGLTVSEVKGSARTDEHPQVFRGTEYGVETVPMLKVEIVVPSPLVPRMVHDLAHWLRTGRVGDGKIFVTDVDGAVRIRTGERGEDAL